VRAAYAEHNQAVGWMEAEQVRNDCQDAVGRANLDPAALRCAPSFRRPATRLAA